MIRKVKGYGHIPTEPGTTSSFNKTGPETSQRRVEEERADMEWEKLLDRFRSPDNGNPASRELRERLAKFKK